MKYVTFDFGPNGGTYCAHLACDMDFDVRVVEDALMSYIGAHQDEDLEPLDILRDVLHSFDDFTYLITPTYTVRV